LIAGFVITHDNSANESNGTAHDPDVTALHETSTEVAVGWKAVLDSWKAHAADMPSIEPADSAL
jgi:hypothetical protein